MSFWRRMFPEQTHSGWNGLHVSLQIKFQEALSPLELARFKQACGRHGILQNIPQPLLSEGYTDADFFLVACYLTNAALHLTQNATRPNNESAVLDAIDIYNSVLAITPGHVPARTGLAEAYGRLGDHKNFRLETEAAMTEIAEIIQDDSFGDRPHEEQSFWVEHYGALCDMLEADDRNDWSLMPAGVGDMILRHVGDEQYRKLTAICKTRDLFALLRDCLIGSASSETSNVAQALTYAGIALTRLSNEIDDPSCSTDAVELYRSALLVDSSCLAARLNLALSYFSLRRHDEAYEEALAGIQRVDQCINAISSGEPCEVDMATATDMKKHFAVLIQRTAAR